LVGKLHIAHYMIGKSPQETAIYRIKSNNRLQLIPQKQFKLEVANIFTQSPDGKHIPAEKFWTENSRRHQRDLVFKPTGAIKPNEYNQWHGFGVEPRKGWQKIDNKKFKYIMKWLAWAGQAAGYGPRLRQPQRGRRQEYARHRDEEDLRGARRYNQRPRRVARPIQ
jgi:hypothetical protein